MSSKILSLICIVSLLSISSSGQIESLDLSFGSDGSTRFTVQDRSTRGTDILILEDHSVIVAVSSELPIGGSLQDRGFYIHRIFADGELDTSFAENGSLHFPYGTDGESVFNRFKLLPNGKILMKCVVNDSSKLIRFNQQGELDNSFGNNGIQDVVSGWNMDVQSNGKIIVQGQYWDGTINRYRFSRYHEDGSLDLSFGDNGTIITSVTDFIYDLCSTICIQDDDKIIAVGYSFNTGVAYHAVISRFDEDGVLDSSFGNNGTVIANFEADTELGEFNDVQLLGDKIIVGGNYHYPGGTGGFGGIKPAVAKFNSDGTYDTTFGENGRIFLETIFGANDRLRAIDVQSNGKVLIGGGASHPFPEMKTYFYITKLHADGSLDESFGQNGVFLTDFDNPEAGSSYVTDIAIHSNYGVLAFGCTYDLTGEDRNAIVCRLADETVSVSELSQDLKINVFPNPTADFVKITSEEAISQIEIYNMRGQLIKNEIISSDSTEVFQDLQSILPGTYLMIISTTGQESYAIQISKI